MRSRIAVRGPGPYVPDSEFTVSSYDLHTSVIEFEQFSFLGSFRLKDCSLYDKTSYWAVRRPFSEVNTKINRAPDRLCFTLERRNRVRGRAKEKVGRLAQAARTPIHAVTL